MKIIIKPVDKKALFVKFLFIGLTLYILLICSVFPFRSFEKLTNGPVCLFKRLTCMPCLFCGITSSLMNSFRLNLKAAFLQNPAGVFIFLAFVMVVIDAILQIATGKAICISTSKREKFIIAAGIVLLLLTSWIFKLI